MVIGSLFGDRPVTVTGYRSPESGQVETSAFHELTAGTTYETIHTVTAGKTFYVTTIIITNRGGAAVDARLGVSSAPVLEVHFKESDTKIIEPPVPMRFASGTAVQAWSNDAGHGQAFTIIGFEE